MCLKKKIGIKFTRIETAAKASFYKWFLFSCKNNPILPSSNFVPYHFVIPKWQSKAESERIS